jgi:hypothetical protein
VVGGWQGLPSLLPPLPLPQIRWAELDSSWAVVYVADPLTHTRALSCVSSFCVWVTDPSLPHVKANIEKAFDELTYETISKWDEEGVISYFLP